MELNRYRPLINRTKVNGCGLYLHVLTKHIGIDKGSHFTCSDKLLLISFLCSDFAADSGFISKFFGDLVSVRSPPRAKLFPL